MILGVRPEDHSRRASIPGSIPEHRVFTAHVDVTENLGHEMLLYLNGVGNDTIIARVDGRSNTRDGSTVKMAIDMNKVHIFDKETEVNVLLQDK